MIAVTQDRTLRVAIFTAMACSIAAAIYTVTDVEPAQIMSTILVFAPLMAVIIWLQKDSQHSGVGNVQDWGMFVSFAWPVVIPWYAFKSRGPRGWRLVVGLAALIWSAYVTWLVVAWATYGVRLALWRLEVGT
jgi:hypothetical protein